jgi:ABC-type transport system substrate-binding protein
LLIVGCTQDAPVTGEGAVEQSVGPGGVVPERAPATLRVALGRDPASLDPRLVADDEGELIVRALFDGLVDVGPDGTVVPAAAGWVVDVDGLVHRFLLRDDRFHDGTRVTAQHHADALLAVLDPERAPLFREDLVRHLRGAWVVDDDGERWALPDEVIEAGGVEVVNDSELVLRLERPDPLFLFRLADPVLVPLPQLAVDDPVRFALEPVGNGPFRMTGPREPGAFVRLRANADHPAPPRIDELVLQIYPDDADRSQRWSDLLAGRLQITAIPIEQRETARELFGTPMRGPNGPGLHESLTTALYAYGFVLDVPPFDDVGLRRAISAAIDRESLVTELLGAGVEPATAMLPLAAGGPLPDCPHCRYDPELAGSLIQDWRGRLSVDSEEPRIVLTYPRGGGHVIIAERIAADLEAHLDLEVRLQAREFGALVRAVAIGEAPLFRYGLRAPLGGRAASVSLLDDVLRPASAANWTRWQDPRTEPLLDAWTPDAPPELVREIEALVLDSAAVIPLLWTRTEVVVHPDVVGFRGDPSGRWWPELIRLR